MTVVHPTLPAQALSLSTRTVRGSRRIRNAVAVGCIYLAVAVALVPLGFLIYYVISKGSGVMSLDFLTKQIPIRDTRFGPGMAPAIVGTLVITGMATFIAVPLGVLGAVYITEYGAANRTATLVQFLSDVMAGVPSIVMGLFIYTIWVLPLKGRGLSAFSGSLALACLMLPIVIRSTESMLRLVPRELREASAALGARRSRTILTVVLPAALPGITSGSLLAVARAAGETAPLLFTIGITFKTKFSLFGSNTALSAQIFSNAQSPYAGAQQRAWGAALTLITLIFVLTIVARLISARFTVREH